MDIGPTDTKTWLSGIAALFTALLTWNFRRFVNAQDQQTLRITELEKDRVTKGDITAVYERIEAVSSQIGDVNTRMGEQHTQIISAITAQKKR